MMRAWAVLDPSVTLERSEVREFFPTPNASTPYRDAAVVVVNLCNAWLGTVIVSPSNEAFLELFELLREPALLEDVVGEFGADDLAQRTLDILIAGGFVHVLDQPVADASKIEMARATWLDKNRTRYRTTFDISLEGTGDPLEAVTRAPRCDVVLRCRDIDEHRFLLRRLLQQQRERITRVLSIGVWSEVLPAFTETRELLFWLGATLHVRGEIRSFTVDSLEPLRRDNLSVTLELAAPWSEVTPSTALRCVEQLQAARIASLRLRPEPEPHDSKAVDPNTVDRALGIFEAELGEFSIVGFPDDDVIVGARLAPPVDVSSRGDGLFEELLRRYLRRKVVAIRAQENMMGPAPSSEADATLIDPAVDLVPNDPSLLRLRPGSVVADICCGAGRTSRRLATHVGPDGAILGIEKERLAIEIGRLINDSEGFTNIHFRQGLAQHLPLADASVDAVVCDWSFNLFLSIGISEIALEEMVRVLRPGGRVAVTQVLSKFNLARLAHQEVYGADEGIDVVDGIERAFEHSGAVDIVFRRLWVTDDRRGGHPFRWYWRTHVPRLVDPVKDMLVADGRRGLLCYTWVAEKRA